MKLLLSVFLLVFGDEFFFFKFTQILNTISTDVAYGYAGFFDLQRVRETELERLIRHDQALFDSLPALDATIDGLAQAVAANGEIQAALQATGAALATISNKFAERLTVMKGE